MVTKAKDCHEAYFGLGKILFSKNEISKAAELFELAIRTFERDPVYMLWAAMALFYQYKRCPKHSPRKRELAVKVEDYAVGCIEANKQDLNALFIYLHLVLDLDLNAAVIRLTPKYKAEDVAVWMKQVDNYKGYLAWVEVYLRRGDKRFATEVLEELIEFYPGNPEAYFRMWSMKRDNPVQAMDVAEKMFLCCTNFYTLETK